MTEAIFTFPVCGGCTLDTAPAMTFTLYAESGINLATLNVFANDIAVVVAGVAIPGWTLGTVAFTNTWGSGYYVTLQRALPFPEESEVCLSVQVSSVSGDPIDSSPEDCDVTPAICCFCIGKTGPACIPVDQCDPEEVPPEPEFDPLLPILAPIGFLCGARLLDPCQPIQFELQTPNANPLRGLTLEIWVGNSRVYFGGAETLPDTWDVQVTPDPLVAPFENNVYVVQIVPVTTPWNRGPHTILFSISDNAGTVSANFQACQVGFAETRGVHRIIQNLSCDRVFIDGVEIPPKQVDSDGNCIGGFIDYQNLPSLQNYIDIGCVAVRFRPIERACS